MKRRLKVIVQEVKVDSRIVLLEMIGMKMVRQVLVNPLGNLLTSKEESREEEEEDSDVVLTGKVRKVTLYTKRSYVKF